jgi:hypothetical protein
MMLVEEFDNSKFAQDEKKLHSRMVTSGEIPIPKVPPLSFGQVYPVLKRGLEEGDNAGKYLYWYKSLCKLIQSKQNVLASFYVIFNWRRRDLLT